MANGSRIAPHVSGLITEAEEGVPCDVCGTLAEVGTFHGVTGERDHPDTGYMLSFNVCTRCAARLIETVSRFRVSRVLDQMYQARDTARNIRLLK